VCGVAPTASGYAVCQSTPSSTYQHADTLGQHGITTRIIWQLKFLAVSLWPHAAK